MFLRVREPGKKTEKKKKVALYGAIFLIPWDGISISVTLALTLTCCTQQSTTEDGNRDELGMQRVQKAKLNTKSSVRTITAPCDTISPKKCEIPKVANCSML